MNQIFVDKMGMGLDELGIILSQKQMEQFYRYYELLTEWNQVMNLTAVTELEDVVEKHFLDSLSLVKAFQRASSAGESLPAEISLIDVGTGAGFPGLPLKIAFPAMRVTLLDSLGKRVKFLCTVIHELGLHEIRAFHGRAEDFGHDSSFRESFDLCVSRAVANSATLTEYCLPFVKVGGQFIAYKSGKIKEEIEASLNAVKLLGGQLEEEVRFRLPGTDAERTLVVIRKVRETIKKYPRKSGVPGREPLR